MTKIMSARKPQMALTALLIVLTTLLAACGDNTPTTASTTTAATTAASATTAAAGATTAAGASTTTAAAAATTAAVAAGPAVKLTVFAPQGPDYNLATNDFMKLLSQKFNIQFTWQTTTWDGAPAKEKRQISLASGDFPDLYWLIPWVDRFTQAELLKYSKQGVVIPLNDLIAQYGPNIQKALDSNPDYKAMATSPDGKIYGLPQWVDCYHCSYADKLWMNSDWLKKLGLKQPTTTQEMKDVLTAFKTKDPNGNGKADEVPLSANVRDVLIPYFMNSFIYDPHTGNNYSTPILNDGKVDIQVNKDGWKQGLAYIKSLYDDGLIDKGAFTQNPDALKAIGDNAGTVILGSATVLHPAIFFTLGSPDGRDKQYDAVPPLKGPSGAQFTGYNFPSLSGASFVLTSKASKEAQIASIKMLDYIFTEEGQIKGTFGTDERTVVKPGPNDVAIAKGVTPLYKTIPRPTGVAPYNTDISAMAQFNNTRAFRDAWVQTTDIYAPDGYERRLQEATGLYAGKEDKSKIFPAWGVWIDPSLGSEVATLQTNIDNYVSQNSLQFITGSKNLDKDWDSYVKGLDAIGLPRYLQIQQEAYDKSTYKK